ncbi:MAG TPA: hypothetical protein VIL26_06335 [Clostridia bacterium]
MQKLTVTELIWIISELENSAEESMQIAVKIKDDEGRKFLERKADLYFNLVKKIRFAVHNNDKRIAIL